MKSIWICFCIVGCNINRWCKATGHLSIMTPNYYFKYLTRFPISEKSCKALCCAGKFFSQVSKIKCAVHMRTCFKMSKSAFINSLLMNGSEWRGKHSTILFLWSLPWTWKVTGFQHKQGSIIFRSFSLCWVRLQCKAMNF